MIILLALLFALFLIHYIYQGLILPTLQMKHKYSLFALRDELRDLRKNNRKEELSFAYDYLQSTINVSLSMIDSIDILFLFKARKLYNENQKLRQVVEDRYYKFSKCDDHKIHNIHNRANDILEYLFLCNSGGFLLYGFTFFVLIFLASKVKEWISKIQFIPEPEMLEIKYS